MSRVWEEIRSAFLTIIKSIKESYEYLGTLVFVSLLWFPISLTVVGYPAATAAAVYVINRLKHKQDVKVKDFFTGLRLFALRATGVWLAHALFVLITYVDIRYFLFAPSWYSKIMGVIFIYVMIFVNLMSNYYISLLVEQDIGFKKIVKRSFLLTLGNLFYTIVISILTVILIFIGAILGPVMLVFLGGLLAFVQNNAIFYLLKKYNALEKREGEYGSEDAAEVQADNWKGFPDVDEKWGGFIDKIDVEGAGNAEAEVEGEISEEAGKGAEEDGREG